jgi:Ubiquitin-activating enzyme E1 FCCH domain
MTQKLVVGPINDGLRTDKTAFAIDNDSFPTLINAYQWRGRVKRKRGTSFLGRLTRFFNSSNTSYSSTSTITLDGSGNGNLITGFGLEPNATIVPGSVTLVGSSGSITYTDPTKDGYLTPTGTGGPNTINYSTGAILIPAQAGATITAIFTYNPTLPVMGLEDFVTNNIQFPSTIAFDTKYSYNLLTASPYPNYDVSFYKNPATGTYPGYIAKANETPTTWNGQNYQQFYTVNYQGALWVTNGITSPFTTANIGMQYKFISAITVTPLGTPPAIALITIAAHGLVQGDFIFINEVVGLIGINYQTGYVITVNNANQVTVEFPNATITGAYVSGGIAQYLTNRSSKTVDSLRFYDGDPTNGSVTMPGLTGNLGWVNFAPPLLQNPGFSIADLPQAPSVYYLVGARMIVPFKDRLLFLGPVIQTSAAGSQVYLQDTIIYSQNGTPYYTASYTNSPNAAADTPASPTNGYTALLVPVNQSAAPNAYFEDQVGFGGFISAAIDQPINTVGTNADVLILGFSQAQARVIYSGNDITPFNFYIINSELGSSSTFSSITMDRAVFTRGSRGFVATSQVEADRIDLPIPDQVFEIQLTNNGTERICSQRDFINEWIYWTYPTNQEVNIFPDQTLQYNYRDNSWAIFNESYTTYGAFRKQTGFTWQTVGLTFPTWESWNESWDSGSSTLLQPKVIAGNQQGFILERDDGTSEGVSLSIQNITGTTVTSPNHNLNQGDYIIITGVLGTIGPNVNHQIFSVGVTTTNTFLLNPTVTTGTYFGGGLITRMYVPFIQTKQFPTAWGDGRKTRIGVQQYLLTTTANSQIELLIFLSQNAASAYNTGSIVPGTAPAPINNSLIYSTTLFTCPENTNLGLTPANINLNMVTAQQQLQTWHRINTSLLGDTVQIGFTMSDTQMRTLMASGDAIPITNITQANPAVITITTDEEEETGYEIGQVIQINNVVGMTQVNGNVYTVTASTATTVTINLNSSSFSAYVSGGTTTLVGPTNQFAEIEIHGFILNVAPSQYLA